MRLAASALFLSLAASPASASQDACGLLSAEDLAAVAGVEGSAPMGGSQRDAQSCMWMSQGGKQILLQLQLKPSASQYETLHKSLARHHRMEPEDLDGIGERAFYAGSSGMGFPTAIVTLEQGGKVLRVQVAARSSQLDALRGETVELARRAAGRL